ncbi:MULTISPECIES: Asp23/Gls24 family envelope stress response protein [Streptomyces]|uniref:Asp23/Gls24 family envelope stress response protein n=1 Tax=Streptomyces TaxID=1883 RepID=UPI002248DEEA|nr:Asp23/Gls24 family envelope stress response protein [Streptomyces sp. JHD 1]MCX2971392.1 Asp23/Gls24 family envelope stress response protein [Streptomyces sp. JHD 1]
MTDPHTAPEDLDARLTAAAARAAEDTPGVASLRPRPTAAPRGAGGGVRVRRTRTPGGWRLHAELRLAVHRTHRALDVTRAARAAVTTALRAAHPADADADADIAVTVTVTALV